MNSALFFPMFNNDLSSNSPLKETSLSNRKNEIAKSFQSIIEGITSKANSSKSEFETQSFHLQEEVSFEIEEKLIDLVKQLKTSTHVEDDGEFIQSLINELEQLFNFPEHQWNELVQNVGEALISEELFSTDENWVGQVISFIFEQMNHSFQSSSLNEASLKNQGNVLARLLTFYLTEGKVTNQPMKASNEMIENMSQLRQVLNAESLPKLEQFFEKLERQLSLTRNDSHANVNVQQTVQKLVNEMFQIKQDEVKPLNHLSLRNVQLHPSIHFGNTMTPVEQYTIFVNQTTNSAGSSQQRIIDQLQQIIQTSRFGQVGGSNQLTIQLKPAHLGDMVLRFVQEDNQLLVRMLVTTKAAKEMLEANLHQLRHMFSPGQIVIERHSADQLQHQLNEYTDEQKEQQDSNQEEQPNKQKQNKNNEQSMSFQDYLFHEEV